MTNEPFKSFDSIEQIGKLYMRITQKIHGTNAQIRIHEYNDTLLIATGSRNRWLMPDDDNYGFSKFVYDNQEAFLNLGIGTHYGEWAGPGINSGEGLTERTLFLFSPPERYLDKALPKNVTVAPELYKGPVDQGKIDEVMQRLLDNGSYAVPGFRDPEGIVVEVAGRRYKKTFKLEESRWNGREVGKKIRPTIEREDFTRLLQPMRLEKLLSRDESYKRDYPETLPFIVKDYIADLIKEEEIPNDEHEINRIRKAASRDIFMFVKTIMMGKK